MQEIVCAWRDEMLQAVTPENQLPETWEESNDKAYYTDKPDWDAFGAMLLVTAAHTYEETIPETLEKAGTSPNIRSSSALPRTTSTSTRFSAA